MKKLIVGLGNPGVKYKYSKHNLGFIVTDAIVASLGIKKWKESARFNAKYCVHDDIAFLKPQTFMNNSGSSVEKFMKYYEISSKNTYVIHDDLDLPFLTIKKQIEAGSAGHNGVEDIIEKLGTKEFWRIRVGIGRPENSKIDISDWVLSNFSKQDIEQLEKLSDDIFKSIQF
jgi:PTH1 family peptidyl-tRNA hydrolase